MSSLARFEANFSNTSYLYLKYGSSLLVLGVWYLGREGEVGDWLEVLLFVGMEVGMEVLIVLAGMEVGGIEVEGMIVDD